MATHLQVFALSDWLAASLPVEYRETTKGLRWMIPHMNPPWQKQHNTSLMNNPLLQQTVDQNGPAVKITILDRRRLLGPDDHSIRHNVELIDESSLSVANFEGRRDVGGWPSYAHSRSRRRLGLNMTIYGPALGPDDYFKYFEVSLTSRSDCDHDFFLWCENCVT